MIGYEYLSRKLSAIMRDNVSEQTQNNLMHVRVGQSQSSNQSQISGPIDAQFILYELIF